MTSLSAGFPAHRLPVRGDGRRPARVRPYSLTGGRTRFGHVLLVETFVAALEAPAVRKLLTDGGPGTRGLMPEMRAIVDEAHRMGRRVAGWDRSCRTGQP